MVRGTQIISGRHDAAPRPAHYHAITHARHRHTRPRVIAALSREVAGSLAPLCIVPPERVPG
jgi:hypothetical protein